MLVWELQSSSTHSNINVREISKILLRELPGRHAFAISCLQMVAANAPSTASWEAALAAVCDGFEAWTGD